MLPAKTNADLPAMFPQPLIPGPVLLAAAACAPDSTGDYVCRATTVGCRLDTRSARWFLGQCVSLP